MTAAALASAGSMADGNVLNSQGFFLQAESMTSIGIDPTTVTAGFDLQSTGGVRENDDGSLTALYNWHEDAPSPPTAEARLTVVSGVSPNSGDTTATWLSLATSRSWDRGSSAIGTDTGVWLIEIRDSDNIVRASAEFTVTVTISAS